MPDLTISLLLERGSLHKLSEMRKEGESSFQGPSSLRPFKSRVLHFAVGSERAYTCVTYAIFAQNAKSTKGRRENEEGLPNFL